MAPLEGGTLTQALVHVGWGLNLAMVASISFAIAGLIWLFAVQSDVVEPAASDDGPREKGAPMMRKDPVTGKWTKFYATGDDDSAMRPVA